MRYFFIGLALAWFGGSAMAVLTNDTGPNCPGMDPLYLGWCE